MDEKEGEKSHKHSIHQIPYPLSILSQTNFLENPRRATLQRYFRSRA